MRIRQNGPDRLVLEDTPWLIGIMTALFILVFAGAGMAMVLDGAVVGLFFGLFGMAMGGAAFAVFVRRTIVFLDRAAGVVLIREATVLGQSETSHPLAEVRRAVVETSHGGKGGPTHRPALDLADGTRLPLRSVFVSGRGAARAVAALNDWLGPHAS